MQKAVNLVNKFVLFSPNICLFLAKNYVFTLNRRFAQIFMPIICIIAYSTSVTYFYEPAVVSVAGARRSSAPVPLGNYRLSLCVVTITVTVTVTVGCLGVRDILILPSAVVISPLQLVTTSN